MLILFVLVSSAYSQVYQKEWDDLYTTVDSVHSFANDIDPNGNVYVMGTAAGATGFFNLLLLKYDQNGSMLWNRKIDGSASIDDIGNAVTCDGSGNSYWLGTINQISPNSSKIAVYKYDPNGNLLWDYESSVDASGLSIKRNSAGDVIIAGNEYTSSSNNAYIISLDEGTGIENWSYSGTINGFSNELNNILIGANNEIFGGGKTNYNSSTNFANYIFKLDVNGLLNWEKLDSVSGSNFNAISAMAQKSNGSIVLASNYALGTSIQRTRILTIDDINGFLESDSSFSFNMWRGEKFKDLMVSSTDHIFATFEVTMGSENNIFSIKMDGDYNRMYEQVHYTKSMKLKDMDLRGDSLIILASGRGIATGAFTAILYDPNGSEIWSKSFENDYTNSIGTAIAFNQGGDIYIAGSGTRAGGSNRVLTLKLSKNDFIIPPDFYGDQISLAHLYFQNKGQLVDEQGNVIKDKVYTSNGAYPTIFSSDNHLSFVEFYYDTVPTPSTTTHRVDLFFKSDFSASMEVTAVYPVKSKQHFYQEHILDGIENVTGYERLIYRNIWDKIDVHLYSGPRGQKISCVMDSGANPLDVTFEFQGQSGITLNSNNLEIETTQNGFGFDQAIAYQLDAQNNIIALSWQPDFVILNGEVSFSNIGIYDPNLPLIFQLENRSGSIGGAKASNGNLEWSSYLSYTAATSNGDVLDEKSVGVDVNDNIVTYLGESLSVFLPGGVGVITIPEGNIDIVLFILNHDLEPLYSTFWGGKGPETAIAVSVNDAKIAMTGYTGGSYIPNSPIPLTHQYTNTSRLIHGDDVAAFIATFETNGTLEWNTLYDQGGKNEYVKDVKIGQDNYLFVVGTINYAFGPIGGGAAPTFNEIAGLSATPSTLQGAGFLLGFNTQKYPVFYTDIAGWTQPLSVDCDDNLNIVICGSTSTNFSSDHGTLPVLNEDPTFHVTPNLLNGSAFVAYIGKTSSNNFETRFIMPYHSGGTESNQGHDAIISDDGTIDVLMSVTGSTGPTKDFGLGGHYQTQIGGTSSNPELRDLFLMELSYPPSAAIGDPVSVKWASYFGSDFNEDFFHDPISDPQLHIFRDQENNIFCTLNMQGVNSSAVEEILLPDNQPLGYYYKEQFATNYIDGGIIGFDSKKKHRWSTLWRGYDEDVIRDGAIYHDNITGENHFYIAGHTWSLNAYYSGVFPFEVNEYNLNFGSGDYYNDLGFSSAYGARFAVNNITLPDTTSPPNTSGINESELNFSIYPNPTNGSINIVGADVIDNISIFDCRGRLVKGKSKINATNVSIDMRDLTSGIYYTRISTINEKTTVIKTIRE